MTSFNPIDENGSNRLSRCDLSLLSDPLAKVRRRSISEFNALDSSIKPSNDDKDHLAFHCPKKRLLSIVRSIFHKVQRFDYSSDYSHQNRVFKNGEYRTTYALNCYGFIAYCIRSFSEEAYQELIHNMYSLRNIVPLSIDGIPCPFNLSAIFKQKHLKHWTHIPKLENVIEGDVIVYLPKNYMPSQFLNSNCKKATGTHVMVVSKVFERTALGFFHFSIIDCTRRPHSITETRYPRLLKFYSSFKKAKKYLCEGGIGEAPVFFFE